MFYYNSMLAVMKIEKYINNKVIYIYKEENSIFSNGSIGSCVFYF